MGALWTLHDAEAWTALLLAHELVLTGSAQPEGWTKGVRRWLMIFRQFACTRVTGLLYPCYGVVDAQRLHNDELRVTFQNNFRLLFSSGEGFRGLSSSLAKFSHLSFSMCRRAP